MLEDKDGLRRVNAAVALWEITGNTEVVAPVVIEALKDEEDRAVVREAAVSAMHTILARGITTLGRGGAVVELQLNGHHISDAMLEHLGELTSLQRLDLRNTPITDAGLKHLGQLVNLETLYLYGAPVTDDGVKNLQQALPNCKITH
jgi:Leucine-rich repeat (LRR) protein